MGFRVDFEGHVQHRAISHVSDARLSFSRDSTPHHNSQVLSMQAELSFISCDPTAERGADDEHHLRSSQSGSMHTSATQPMCVQPSIMSACLGVEFLFLQYCI